MRKKLQRIRRLDEYTGGVFRNVFENNAYPDKERMEALSHIAGDDVLVYCSVKYPKTVCVSYYDTTHARQLLEKFGMGSEYSYYRRSPFSRYAIFQPGIDYDLAKGMVSFCDFQMMFRFLLRNEFSLEEIADVIYSIMGRGKSKLVLDLRLAFFEKLQNLGFFEKYFVEYKYTRYKSSNLSNMVLMVLKRPGVSRFKYDLKRYKAKKPIIFTRKPQYNPTGNCQLLATEPKAIGVEGKGVPAVYKPLGLAVCSKGMKFKYKEITSLPIDGKRKIVIVNLLNKLE